MEALRYPAWIVGLSLMGVGTLAGNIGIPFWTAVASTPLIWAGPAQLVLFGGLAAGGSLVSIAIAVTLTSARLLPSSVSLLALIPGIRQRFLLRVLVAHYVVVITWVEGMKRLPRVHRRDRLAWILGFSNACVLVSTACTAIGYAVSATLPTAIAAGFMFGTPMFFTLALVSGVRSLADGAAIALGAGLILVLPGLVGPDLDVLVAGTAGGLVAYTIRRASL